MKIALFIAIALLFLLVPIIAFLFGEWYAYWGHGLLAILFGVLVVYLRTNYYWRED